MSDVRKLLARLNPASMQYDGARGGFGGMTAQDIAGALGMVPYGLGREVMAVAKARGVTPLGFNGFNPAAFMPGSSSGVVPVLFGTKYHP